MRFAFAATLSLVLPATVHAEPITFSGALERAASNAASIKGADARIAAARSASIAADRLPDPTLDLGIRDFPVTGRDAGRLNRDDFTMTTVGISQQFINPAKRRARAARAQAEIGIAEAEQVVEVRAVLLETALAWIDLYYGERRLEQLHLLDGSLSELQATVAARLASGAARPSQAFEPDQLRAAVADRRSTIEAEISKAQARLARFTGIADGDPSGPPPREELDPSALRASLGALPQLAELSARATAADADTRIARAERRPDWKVSLSYGRREPNFGDLVSLGVSIDLPLFSKRRQDPKIAAQASEAERARLTRLATEQEVRAALDADLADHAMHDRQLANARNTLVPLAKKRAELDRDSYGAGQLDLGSALLSTLALAEAEVEALAREAQVARDAVRINYTYTGDIK